MKTHLVLFLLLCTLPGAAPLALADPPASQPAAAPAAPTADQLYTAIFDTWSDGDQSKAESVLRVVLKRHPDDQRLAFFAAACARSRFDVPAAYPLFAQSVRINATSLEGRCAGDMIRIDTDRLLALDAYNDLKKLADDHAGDPLPQWLVGIAARALDKPAEGVVYYRRLMKLITVGSSLVHQTFANELHDLKLFDEALEHRKLAVKLEPAGWSYQGLGNTLRRLKRFPEASAAFQFATQLAPNDDRFWMQWGACMYEWGEYNEGIERAMKAIQLNPSNVDAFILMGQCWEGLGQFEDANTHYARILKKAPQCWEVYPLRAGVLKKLKRDAEADALMKQMHDLQDQKKSTAAAR